MKSVGAAAVSVERLSNNVNRVKGAYGLAATLSDNYGGRDTEGGTFRSDLDRPDLHDLDISFSEFDALQRPAVRRRDLSMWAALAFGCDPSEVSALQVFTWVAGLGQHDLDAVADLEDDLGIRAGSVRRGSSAERLLRLLLARPIFSVDSAAAAIERSTVATGQAVNQLTESGVLSPASSPAS